MEQKIGSKMCDVIYEWLLIGNDIKQLRSQKFGVGGTVSHIYLKSSCNISSKSTYILCIECLAVKT